MKRCGLLKLAKIDAEDAGLHFLLRVCGPVPAEKITRRAAENGVRVTGLSAYYHTAPVNPQTAFVISYSEIPDACITEAVNRLAKAVTAAVMGRDDKKPAARKDKILSLWTVGLVIYFALRNMKCVLPYL